MVLEERVIFTGSEDAATFVAFLRKNGCPCRKEVQAVCSETEFLTGTIDQIIPWLGTEAVRCEEDGAETDAAWFRNAEEFYRNTRDVLHEIIAGKNPGDLIFTRRDIVTDIQEFIDRAKDSGIRGNLEISKEIGRPAARSLALVLLIQNRAISEDQEGFHLDTVIPEGSLIVELEIENVPQIDPDALTGMTTKLSCHYSLLHVVIADPLIHLTCDTDEVLDLLEDLSVPEEVLWAVADNLAQKSLLVSTLLYKVEQEKSIDVASLAGHLDGLEVKATDDATPVTLEIGKEMVTAVVAELRKRDILAGTDQKVRMAGGKKRR
jgi:hypothetical protein